MSELDRLQKLCDKATPLPWWNESGVIHAKHPTKWKEENHSCIHVAKVDCEYLQDSDFITEARSAMPKLIVIARVAKMLRSMGIGLDYDDECISCLSSSPDIEDHDEDCEYVLLDKAFKELEGEDGNNR